MMKTIYWYWNNYCNIFKLTNTQNFRLRCNKVANVMIIVLRGVREVGTLYLATAWPSNITLPIWWKASNIYKISVLLLRQNKIIHHHHTNCKIMINFSVFHHHIAGQNLKVRRLTTPNCTLAIPHINSLWNICNETSEWSDILPCW